MPIIVDKPIVTVMGTPIMMKVKKITKKMTTGITLVPSCKTN